MTEMKNDSTTSNDMDPILKAKSEEDGEGLRKTLFLPKFTKWQMLVRLIKFQVSFYMILAEIINLFIDGLDMYSPIVEGKIINAITVEKSYESLSYWTQIRVGVLVVNIISSKLKMIVGTYLTVNEDIKTNFLENVLNKDMEFFDNFKPAFIQEAKGTLYIMNYSIRMLFYLSRTLLKLCLGIYALITVSFELFLIQLASLAYRTYCDSKFSYNNWDERASLCGTRDQIFDESILNIKIVKCFSLENKVFNSYFKNVQKIIEISKLNSSGEMWDEKEVVTKGFDVMQLLYMGNMVLKGQVGFGDFTKFQLIAEDLSNSVTDFFFQVRQLKEDFYKIENIFGILELQAKISHGKKPQNILQSFKRKISLINFGQNKAAQENEKDANFQGYIEFRNVDFRYPIRPKAQILNNLSFKIDRGDVVAFVGGSGSGKSTIASLFHRLYDPENGVVLIDNKNIKDIDVHLLHNKIGYVSQEPCLFTLTIRENILFGLNKEYTTDEEKQKLEEKLNSIIKKANCGFVYDKSIFPDGLDTLVSGNNLSGGQKQRIGIARALMKEVNFLIFDEATSALDANSESEVQKAIDEIIKEANITTIIIAHRLSTIKNCHKIFVLKKGTVVEEGTHKELKKLNGFYKELINKQLEAYDKEDQETLLRKKTSQII